MSLKVEQLKNVLELFPRYFVEHLGAALMNLAFTGLLCSFGSQ